MNGGGRTGLAGRSRDRQKCWQGGELFATCVLLTRSDIYNGCRATMGLGRAAQLPGLLSCQGQHEGGSADAGRPMLWPFVSRVLVEFKEEVLILSLPSGKRRGRVEVLFFLFIF